MVRLPSDLVATPHLRPVLEQKVSWKVAASAETPPPAQEATPATPAPAAAPAPAPTPSTPSFTEIMAFDGAPEIINGRLVSPYLGANMHTMVAVAFPLQ